MFWKKYKPSHIENIYDILTANKLTIPPTEEVSCSVCKHRILKSDAKTVKGDEVSVDRKPLVIGNIGDSVYYCPEHKPPYDETRMCYPSECLVGGIGCTGQHKRKYYKIIPEHKVEVDEKGKEIK
jgi:hypothetical protein